jgi:hypothetical protein
MTPSNPTSSPAATFRTQLPAVADVADDPRWQPHLAELAQVEQVRRLVGEGHDDAPLTLSQAARIVGVSTKTMYRRAGEDGSPFYKLTPKGRWQVEPQALADWVERKAAAAAPSPTPLRRRPKGKGGGLRKLDDE